MTGGPGSSSLYDAQSISRKQSDRAEKVSWLVKKIQSGWQGNAADEAYGAATLLAGRNRSAGHLDYTITNHSGGTMTVTGGDSESCWPGSYFTRTGDVW